MTDLDAKRRALEKAVRVPYEGHVWAGDPAAYTMALADEYALAARADVERIFRTQLERRLAQLEFPVVERDLEPWVFAFNRCQREAEALEATLRESPEKGKD